MVRGAAIRLQAHTVRPKAHDTNGLCVNVVKTAKKYLKRLAKTDDLNKSKNCISLYNNSDLKT